MYLIDTSQAAEYSTTIYSLGESIKDNNLKLLNYCKYILEEIPKHQHYTNLNFSDFFLTWDPEIFRMAVENKKDNITVASRRLIF